MTDYNFCLQINPEEVVVSNMRQIFRLCAVKFCYLINYLPDQKSISSRPRVWTGVYMLISGLDRCMYKLISSVDRCVCVHVRVCMCVPTCLHGQVCACPCARFRACLSGQVFVYELISCLDRRVYKLISCLRQVTVYI